VIDLKKEAEILAKLRDVVVDMDYEGVSSACKEAIETGIPAYRAVSEGMAKGMEIVGEKYESSEYFLAELIMAGEIMKKGMKVLQPYFRSDEVRKKGKVVIGTVRRDLHDIGKNIFSSLLSAAGFEVMDFGVDVPAEKFVDAVRQYDPDIVAMSALLSTTMPEMENVIKALEDAKFREKVKVIIGGAPITREYAKKIGADFAAKNAVEGVNICNSWMSR